MDFWVLSSLLEKNIAMNSFVPILFAFSQCVYGIESWKCHCWVRAAYVIWLNNAKRVSVVLHHFCICNTIIGDIIFIFYFLITFIYYSLKKIMKGCEIFKGFFKSIKIIRWFYLFYFLFKLWWILRLSIIKQDFRFWGKSTLIKMYYILKN